MADTSERPSKEDEFMSRLFQTCSDGKIRQVEDLLTNNTGMNIGAQNAGGDTVMHAAAAAGHVDVARLLKANGVSTNTANATKDTPMHLAAKYGHVPFVIFLHEDGNDVNVINEAGQTAIHLAARGGHGELVEWLLQVGADANVKDLRGRTPLHVACQAKQVLTAVVLSHFPGTRLDIHDQVGLTALHVACRENLLAVVKILCARGAPVNSKTQQDGSTPLHLAAKNGDPEMLRYLVLAGADIDEYTQDNVQAEELARAQGHTEAADLLSKLTSSLVRDRGDAYARQLAPSGKQFSRIRVNVLGNSAVGKTTLIESLKCGYIRSLFRRSGASWLAAKSAAYGAGPNDIELSPSRDRVHGTSRAWTKLPPTNEQYTRGIDIQQVNISVAGDVSIWEYSGYEPYYVLYDRFLGDPNAVYVIVVSLRDDVTERRKQIDFWLNFIRTRTMPFEPIGFGGTKLWVPRVLLVATHADHEPTAVTTGKAENDASSSDFELLDRLLKSYYADIALEPHVFRMDANQAMGPEMKVLRQTIATIKKMICESLPPTLGILDPTLTTLNDWRRVLSGFPVVSWPTFADYIRSRINVLATDEHLRELIGQLHIMGELVSIVREDQEMIVVNPRWLCSDVLGRLLSYDSFVQSPSDGRVGLPDLQSMFPKTDPKDVAFVLDGLELLSPSDGRGQRPDTDFIVLCFDNSEPPENELTRPVGDQEVIGGFYVTAQYDHQLLHVFVRIVFQLRRRLQMMAASGEDGQVKVVQWNSGAVIHRGKMTCVLRLVGSGSGIMVTCRGPVGQRDKLFFFQEDMCEIVYTALETCLPALYLERAPISASDLRAGTPTPHVYEPRDIALAQLAGQTAVPRGEQSPEPLVDLVAYGSTDIFSRLRPGIDQSVGSLSLYARYRMASLLDPPKDGAAALRSSSGGWTALAAAVGLSAEAERIEKEAMAAGASPPYSPTDLILTDWARSDADATIRALRDKLVALDRMDVVDALLSVTPLYRYLADDGRVDADRGTTVLRSTSGGAAAGTAGV